jgi:hypothetical protein
MKNNNIGLMKKNVLKLNEKINKKPPKKEQNQSYNDLTLDLSKDDEIIKKSPGGLFDKSIINGIETMDSIFKMKEMELINNSNRLQTDSNKSNNSIGTVRMSGILNNTSREDITINNEINYPVNNELNDAVIIEKKKCCWNKILYILLFVFIGFFIFLFGGCLTYVLLLKHQQNTNKNNSNTNKSL